MSRNRESFLIITGIQVTDNGNRFGVWLWIKINLSVEWQTLNFLLMTTILYVKLETIGNTETKREFVGQKHEEKSKAFHSYFMFNWTGSIIMKSLYTRQMLEAKGLWYDQSNFLYDLFSRGHVSRQKKSKSRNLNWTRVMIWSDERTGNMGSWSVSNQHMKLCVMKSWFYFT